jgi:hypothetical protein
MWNEVLLYLNSQSTYFKPGLLFGIKCGRIKFYTKEDTLTVCEGIFEWLWTVILVRVAVYYTIFFKINICTIVDVVSREIHINSEPKICFCGYRPNYRICFPVVSFLAGTNVSLIARIHPSRLANLDFNLLMEIEAACELLVHVLTASFFRKVTKSACAY